MSHDDYIILSPDSQNESNIRPPMKPYPVGKQNNMLPQRRQREFCWPFSCCCKLFSKNNKSSNIQENEHSDDSLLFETECPPKSSHQPLHHHTEISNNYSPCDGFNSIKECDSESDSTEEEHNSEDDNENQEPEEYDYPGSDLQNAIALSLQCAGIGSAPTEPECVICLDVFDPTNPRLPTLCRCGIGKVNFHFDCLKKWISQNGGSTCPSCYTTLFYEELEPIVAEPSSFSMNLLNNENDDINHDINDNQDNENNSDHENPQNDETPVT